MFTVRMKSHNAMTINFFLSFIISCFKLTLSLCSSRTIVLSTLDRSNQSTNTSCGFFTTALALLFAIRAYRPEGYDAGRRQRAPAGKAGPRRARARARAIARALASAARGSPSADSRSPPALAEERPEGSQRQLDPIGN